jgi:hypothetical protein
MDDLRRLENGDNPKLKAWVAAQNAFYDATHQLECRTPHQH